jgi:uncharacterized protein (TIGR02145 family)
MKYSYNFLINSITGFCLFLILSSLEFSAYGQNYPLRSIESIQWVHPDTLLTGKTLSRYVGDTVRVRGVVILNPRDHALSSSWKATYLVDTQNLNIGGWKGLIVRLQNLADSSAIGFFSNFQVGNIVECTGVVAEFQDASPNSGETQLNLIGVASSVLGFATPPAPRLSFMNQFMVYDPNNPTVPQQIQKPTGEPYEGMYVQFNNVLVTNVSTFSGGRVSWMIRDALGSEFNVRDAIRFFRPPFVSSTASVPANPGAPVFVQQGKVFSHVRGVITETNFGTLYPRYELVPLTPSDLGAVVSSPPIIYQWNATPSVVLPNNSVTIGAKIRDLDGSIASAKLFYAPDLNGGVYDSLPMALVAPDSFQVTIPASALIQSAIHYRYFIKSTDAQNNAAIQPDTNINFGQFYVLPNGFSIVSTNNCGYDTALIEIQNPMLIGVANAALRITYNPDSLTYLGFQNLHSNFNGMIVNAGNGVITMDWISSINQNIAPGSMLKLRFRVLGSSPLTWDTVFIPSELYDANYNVIPSTFFSGNLTNSSVSYNLQTQICQGQSFTLNGQTYNFSTGGNYQIILPGSGNVCDTLIYLNLSFLSTQSSITATTCSNHPYNFGGRNLNVSGVYRDTLINALGCDSIVTLTLTVNPSYQNSISVVQCAGTPYLFGGQFLNASGTYNQTFTSMVGCDSVVQLNLVLSDSLLINSQGGVNGFCPGGTLRLGTSALFSSGTFRWKLNGAVLGSASSDTFLASQAGSYQLEVILSPTCTLTSNVLIISLLNCNELTGDLRYDNAGLTPLAGVLVQLKTLLGNVVASDTTDSSGVYRMVGYSNGNYILDAEINYNWGGTNSTDALLVNRYFTSLVSLTPLRARAGDVNGNQITNSGDALLISRRITNLVLGFPVGSFVTARPTITAHGNPLFMTLRALSTGDVNGSYSIQPSAPTLVIDTVYGNGIIGTAVVRFTNPGSGVFERGIVWSSSPNPLITSSRSVAGKGGFGFTQNFGGVTVGSQYYVRAYARTSAGVFYSPERSFTPIPGLLCPGTPSVTDIDGNIYNSVQIGTQCWMQSNLKVTKYRNGDNIPTGLSNTSWENTTAGAYAIYENNILNDGLHGKLYNHYAVIDNRGLCPTGWHVPTDGEWNQLVKYLDPNADTSGGITQSTTAGGAMKSTATQPAPGGWDQPNTGASNSSGFTARPGGRRDIAGDFEYFSTSGFWWSSSLSGILARGRLLYCLNGDIYRADYYRITGFSVRCIRDVMPSVSTTTVSNVTATNATTGGNVSQDGGASITARGVAYGTSSSPTISGSITIDGTGIGSFTSNLTGLTPSTTYYVRAYATNSVGTAYGNDLTLTTLAIPGLRCPGTPTVNDIVGNLYYTVQIGTQCWTQSNLKVSKYRNGDSIPTGFSNTAWESTTAGAYANYDNNPVNDGLYGKLYNHYAVMDTRGLCPTGWHVPTDGEWTVLETFLGGSSVSGGALKSTLTNPPTPWGWNWPNTDATNSSGFTAEPGGLRGNAGTFGAVGVNGVWWSSSLSGALAWYRALGYAIGLIYRSNDKSRTNGFSVRCLRDIEPSVSTSTVSNVTATSATTGGDVSQDGGAPVTARGVAYGTSSSPITSGSITNDGAGTGVYTSTLAGLTPSTTYYVRAYATNTVGTAYGNELIFTTPVIPAFTCGTSTVSDVDGNSYNTVQIGNQCWTQSNLKVSKYRNGDIIPTGLGNSAWQNSTSGAFAIYDNNLVNDGLFGKLYNHYAVMDTRGLCPTGWHVASDVDWNVLVKLLDFSSDTICNNCYQSSIAGGMLKSNATQPTQGGWYVSSIGATNTSGFTAEPGGFRNPTGSFIGFQYFGYWWTSSLHSAGALARRLDYDTGIILRFNSISTYGFSVRCVKNL